MNEVHPSLPITRTELTAFCERWHVKELALFGSAARQSDFGPESDFDLMVEFDAASHMGLWEFFGMKEELEELLGRSVDLVVKGTIINPYRRRSIERDLSVIYAA